VDFEPFDTRGYPVVPPREGYTRWAETYEDSVLDLMDLALLDRIESVPWASITRAADLACGTGRTGAWLSTHGVGAIDGVDLTPEMLERARTRGVHDRLIEADLRDTGLDAGACELAVVSLADEHIPSVAPMYAEAARLATRWFVVVGYHPFFLMGGMPTHFHLPTGEPVAIESHVHLFADHVAAARAHAWRLAELHEAVIDDAWIERKPKWSDQRGRPISFAAVWAR